MNTAVCVRAAEKKALPKKFMRSDKSSQMRVFYVRLIVEGVNEDITPGQELEEEIRQRGEEGEGLEGGRLRGTHGLVEVFCQRRPQDLQQHCHHDLMLRSKIHLQFQG